VRHPRRLALAVALSVGAHVLVVAILAGSSLMGAWPSVPIDVEIAGMQMEEPTDLPLGAPTAGAEQAAAPPGPAPAEEVVAPRAETGPPPAKKPKPLPRPPGPGPDPAASRPTPPPRPQSVRSYGPAGSRVTVLMRIDRLRGTPYTDGVDALLMRLPDRRDLLEGTDLDLYRDIDALLVATPNPLDPAVTFLAVRHRLTDTALREALERGARATGRTLKWHSERGRPYAERLAAGPGQAGAVTGGRRRDERLVLLVAPKLAVVTPPAYRRLILRGRPAVGAGGAGGAGGATEPAGGPVGRGGATGTIVRGAGGAPGTDAAADEHADWAALVRRIDAEDSIMPADAVVMLSAEDLFTPGGSRHHRSARVVAGTRGTVDDPGDDSATRRPRGTILGLPAPRLLTATIGIAPEPFSDVEVTFSDEDDAVEWEREWPALRQKLRTNPLVVLTGFSGLAGRVTLARTGTSLHVHLQATELEMIRLLQLLATQLPSLSAGG
jgi:hypothetical protein